MVFKLSWTQVRVLIWEIFDWKIYLSEYHVPSILYNTHSTRKNIVSLFRTTVCRESGNTAWFYDELFEVFGWRFFHLENSPYLPKYVQMKCKSELSYFCRTLENVRRTSSLQGHYLTKNLDIIAYIYQLVK